MIQRLLFIFSIFAVFTTVYSKLKLGIVGGGIGGSAVAYYIRKHFAEDVDLTIFEAESIGGRLRSLELSGRKYEAGGAIAIPRNRLMVSLLDELDLKKRNVQPSSYAGLFNGKEVLFAESDWLAVNVLKVFWRYGMAIQSLNAHTGLLLDAFDNIYGLQDKNAAFENVTSLINAMHPHLVEAMQISSQEGFEKAGFSQLIIDELVAATIRVNYGQTTAIHKFVGSVSVAGASGGLWAVEGGNQRVPERLTEESKARVLHQPVRTVTRLPSGRLTVTVAARSDIPPDEPEYAFDAVVIAAPQTEDMRHKISFQGFQQPIVFPGRYHRTVCTILSGSLRIESFPGAYAYTDEILTIVDNLNFNSIGRIYPVDSTNPVNDSNVWKIFSQQPLTEEQLSGLFTEYRDITVTDWLAYPHYDAKARSDNFVLAPALYHVNAIEWAASAMEMSLVGARNVANLVRNKWCSEHKCPQKVVRKMSSTDEL